LSVKAPAEMLNPPIENFLAMVLATILFGVHVHFFHEKRDNIREHSKMT